MALAETAELVAKFSLHDGVTGPANRIKGTMGHLQNASARVGQGLQTLGNNLMRIAKSGVLVLGAALGYSIKKAEEFNAQMLLVQTQAGASAAEVDSMKKSLLAMADQVGSTPDELAKGLYHIESAGIRGAKALDLLQIAAEGAAVGNTDLESVTNALIAATNSGIKGVSSMGQAMGVLNGIVGAGNMRMGDLTAAFTTGILSSAKAFGVTIASSS